jgi:uncharacterized protein YqiB (DUF1249 family)
LIDPRHTQIIFSDWTMAENQPPANVPPAMVDRYENQRKAPDEPANDEDDVSRLEFDSERKMRVSAEKKLAQANALLEQMKGAATLLLAKTVMEKSTLSDLLKSQKDLARKELDVAEKKLAKASQQVEKTEGLLAKRIVEKSSLTALLQAQKNLGKKELEAESALVEAQTTLKKDANAAKASLKKEITKLEKKCESLEKAGETSKSKISDLNASLADWMKTKTDLKAEVKRLVKELKASTKKVDSQVEKKLEHAFSLQELKNKSKQLELDLVREKLLEKKLQTKKAPPPPKTAKAGALTLQEKMDFESHKAEVKRIQKEDDATRDKMKKDTKAADIRNNLGFASNLLQNRTNGGMWDTGLVSDVSCALSFCTNPFFCVTNPFLRILAISLLRISLPIISLRRRASLTQCVSPQ